MLTYDDIERHLWGFLCKEIIIYKEIIRCIEEKYGYVTQKTVEDIYDKMKLFIEKGYEIKQKFDGKQYNENIISTLEKIF